MKEIPVEVMKATSDLIESCSIEVDDSIDEKFNPIILSRINEHNLELNSLIHTASASALAELLVNKGIITKEEYQNSLYLKLIENKDIVENLALKAHTLKSAMMHENNAESNENDTDITE